MAKLKILTQTPPPSGYTFPPEWAPHAALVQLGRGRKAFRFPTNITPFRKTSQGSSAKSPPREQVHINVPNGNYERIVREQLTEHGCPLRNIFFHHIKTNESWCRDHGPAFVKEGANAGGSSIGNSTPGAENIRRMMMTTRSRRESPSN